MKSVSTRGAMGGIPDTVLVAIIMAIPTLLVYFGSRKKQKAETEGVISDNWQKLTKSQNEFNDQMEDRLKVLNDKVAAQETLLVQQNDTIAKQNDTIARQSQIIAVQSERINEQ